VANSPDFVEVLQISPSGGVSGYLVIESSGLPMPMVHSMVGTSPTNMINIMVHADDNKGRVIITLLS